MLRITQPFWRKEPLSHPERRLLNAVLIAHAESAARDNVSSVTVKNVAVGSGGYCNAIAAGLLSIGGPHAPIADTITLLESEHPSLVALQMLKRGQKVPGWGSSFQNNGVGDPIWFDVEELLAAEFLPLYRKVASVTLALAEAGKQLRPNPSCFTAAAAIITKLPKPLAPYLFIAGRLDGWSKFFTQNQ